MTDTASRHPRAMTERDGVMKLLGLRVERDDPGHAVVSMKVRDDMTNGYRITHGGIIFTLADASFALASNEDEYMTVGAGADINFLKTTTCGQTLTATAVRRVRFGRNGVYDVTVVDESGETVAEFRGRSFITKRIFEEQGKGS